MTEQFVGRGENLAAVIIGRLLNTVTISQNPLEYLICQEEFKTLDKEVQKHKFDLAANHDSQKLVIEINYKHKEKAARKWNDIFVPLLKKHNYVPVAINDYNCRNLFKQNKKKQHKLAWDDFRDVIDALEMAGVTP